MVRFLRVSDGEEGDEKKVGDWSTSSACIYNISTTVHVALVKFSVELDIVRNKMLVYCELDERAAVEHGEQMFVTWYIRTSFTNAFQIVSLRNFERSFAIYSKQDVILYK